MIKLISSLNETAMSNGMHPTRYLNWGGKVEVPSRRQSLQSPKQGKNKK